MNLPLMFLLVSFAFVSGPMHGQSARQPHLAGPADVVRQYCDFDVKIGRISTDNFQKLPPLCTWDDEPGWDRVTLVSGFKITSTKITADRAVVTVAWQVIGEFGGGQVEATRPKEEVIEYQLKLVGGLWKIDSPVLCPHVSTSPCAPLYWPTIRTMPTGRS